VVEEVLGFWLSMLVGQQTGHPICKKQYWYVDGALDILRVSVAVCTAAISVISSCSKVNSALIFLCGLTRVDLKHWPLREGRG